MSKLLEDLALVLGLRLDKLHLVAIAYGGSHVGLLSLGVQPMADPMLRRQHKYAQEHVSIAQAQQQHGG
jgi:hypothetical protein